MYSQPEVCSVLSKFGWYGTFFPRHREPKQAGGIAPYEGNEPPSIHFSRLCERLSRPKQSKIIIQQLGGSSFRAPLACPLTLP